MSINLKNFIEVLKVIHNIFEKHSIRWVLIGSLSLALQGVQITPKDIDILTNRKGALKCNEIIKDYIEQPVKYAKTPVYKSYFGKFRIKAVLVEIMGELWIKRNNQWISLISRLENAHILMIGNLKLYVTPIEEHLKISEGSQIKKEKERYNLIIDAMREKN